MEGGGKTGNYVNKLRDRRKTKKQLLKIGRERETVKEREREAWSVRGEAQQILSGGEIALLRIYCFKCNWVQPAPGEKNPLKSPLLCRMLLLCEQPCCSATTWLHTLLRTFISPIRSKHKQSWGVRVSEGVAKKRSPHNSNYLTAQFSVPISWLWAALPVMVIPFKNVLALLWAVIDLWSMSFEEFLFGYILLEVDRTITVLVPHLSTCVQYCNVYMDLLKPRLQPLGSAVTHNLSPSFSGISYFQGAVKLYKSFCVFLRITCENGGRLSTYNLDNQSSLYSCDTAAAAMLYIFIWFTLNTILAVWQRSKEVTVLSVMLFIHAALLNNEIQLQQQPLPSLFSIISDGNELLDLILSTVCR